MITVYDLQGNVALQNLNAEGEMQSDSDSNTTAKINSGSIDYNTFLPYFKKREDVKELLEKVLKGDQVKMQVENSSLFLDNFLGKSEAAKRQTNSFSAWKQIPGPSDWKSNDFDTRRRYNSGFKQPISFH